MVHVPLWSQPVLEHLCRLPCALRRLHLQCVLHQSPMQCWLPEWWSSILIKQGDLSPVSCLQCHHQMSLPCTHTWVLSSRLLHPELISEKILQQIYFLCWLILWSLKKKKKWFMLDCSPAWRGSLSVKLMIKFKFVPSCGTLQKTSTSPSVQTQQTEAFLFVLSLNQN